MSICRDNTQSVDLSFSVFSAIAVIIELVLGVFKKVSKVVCVSFELSEGFLCWLITTRSYSPSISGFGVSWDPLVSTKLKNSPYKSNKAFLVLEEGVEGPQDSKRELETQ